MIAIAVAILTLSNERICHKIMNERYPARIRKRTEDGQLGQVLCQRSKIKKLESKLILITSSNSVSVQVSHSLKSHSAHGGINPSASGLS